MKKRTSWIWMVTAALAGALVTFLIHARSEVPARPHVTPEAAKGPAPAAPCGYTTAHVRGFHRVRPVLFSEPMCESPRFHGLRNAIEALVGQLRTGGKMTSASVYVRDFNKAEWTWFNGDELYDPGSLLKVAILLSWLSMVDEDPSLLQRSWVCAPSEAAMAQNTGFPSAQAQAGRSYTVARLFELMIVNSDNRATTMLMHHMEPERFFRTFEGLGLPAPERDTKSYRVNVRDYSVFMKALYHSSFLSPIRSEYALELMTRSEFRSGLAAGLPASVEMAHESGEAGDTAEKQLHGTGLVYLEGNPYLITVMTRGQQADALAVGIASISRLVYDHMRSIEPSATVGPI